jgi:hypothetical protein
MRPCLCRGWRWATARGFRVSSCAAVCSSFADTLASDAEASGANSCSALASPASGATIRARDLIGLIVSPRPGESVERVDVRGTLANIPEEQHVWVLVRDGNLLYPHEPEVTPREGEWSLRINHGGDNTLISLELWRSR